MPSTLETILLVAYIVPLLPVFRYAARRSARNSFSCNHLLKPNWEELRDTTYISIFDTEYNHSMCSIYHAPGCWQLQESPDAEDMFNGAIVALTWPIAAVLASLKWFISYGDLPGVREERARIRAEEAEKMYELLMKGDA